MNRQRLLCKSEGLKMGNRVSKLRPYSQKLKWSYLFDLCLLDFLQGDSDLLCLQLCSLLLLGGHKGAKLMHLSLAGQPHLLQSCLSSVLRQETRHHAHTTSPATFLHHGVMWKSDVPIFLTCPLQQDAMTSILQVVYTSTCVSGCLS